MIIEISDNFCILTPVCADLNITESNKIFKFIKNENKRVGVDLSNICSFSYFFIENLIKTAKIKSISLFNIPDDLFVLFNTMNTGKTVDLFVNDIDFRENSRKLINRQFSVVD